MVTRSKWLVSIVALVSAAAVVEGQTNAPALRQQASFGGSANEVPFQIRLTPDGGILMGGESVSTMETGPARFGRKDFWLVQLSSAGAVAWSRSYGGAADDQLYAVQIVKTNQVLLAGASASPPSGNKTSSNYGMRDFWILLADATGQKIWERYYGGTGDDFAPARRKPRTAGFVVAGYSQSAGGGNKMAPFAAKGTSGSCGSTRMATSSGIRVTEARARTALSAWSLCREARWCWPATPTPHREGTSAAQLRLLRPVVAEAGLGRRCGLGKGLRRGLG